MTALELRRRADTTESPGPNGDGAYPSLFRPIDIRGVTLPNRIVRTSHGTGLAATTIGEDLIAYHRERARGGVGLTILEVGGVHPSDPASMPVLDDTIVGGYLKLRKALEPYPMKLFQQLGHAGSFGHPPHGAPWAPSPVSSFFSEAAGHPRALTTAQIDELVSAFAAAAARVVDGGLDGIEIHAGHGLLIAQFLSPLTNRRTDRYGGSAENRRRLLVEILSAVRAAAGPIPVGIRLSADEMTEGGIVPADAIATVQALEQRSLIDFVDLSIGGGYSYQRVIGGMDEELGYELPFTLPVAAEVSVPTIVVGRIKSLAQAEEIVGGGKADLVSLVRALIADPELVAKSRRGEVRRVRPCIGCNQGCLGGYVTKGRIGCAVNADAGEEARRPRPTKVERPRRVVVAGGGPAGMEAARVAATRGHEVVLCEARDRLSGQLEIARKAPFRHEIGEIADWLAAELCEVGVDVRLGTSVTPEVVRALQPDALIVATGSRPRTDSMQTARPLAGALPGSDQPHVVSSWSVLSSEAHAPREAVIYDDVGHYEGLAVAELLLARGARVTIATRHTRLAPLMEPARATVPAKIRLAQQPFELITESYIEAIDETSVRLRHVYGGAARSLESEFVVLVLHNAPDHGLAEALRDQVESMHIVGDALSPRFLQVAIEEGNRAGARV